MVRIPRRQSSVRNRLLAALPPADWVQLEHHLEVAELPFDQVLHVAGQPIDAVYFVETGMVSLVVTLESGEQVEAGIAGSEGLVGLPVIYGDNLAVTESRVQLEGNALKLNAATLRAELDRSSALRNLLLRYALAFHTQVTMTVACNARHAIENRLARWLLIAHDRAELDEFAMTHEFLSLMLGVRRPGVTIAAGMLQRAGLIQYARGKITVTDRPSLEAASCECYHAVRHAFTRLLG
ncbi:Crp/Fnr family transcriptional regulator [Roseomonas sp. CAU 1739]|uniref:Crp/Fnr family transcriptional regulator n=1 Tax=Roseomonas sp. CAU 1739 TaxID=3140364 RepID=UPI00325A9217